MNGLTSDIDSDRVSAAIDVSRELGRGTYRPDFEKFGYPLDPP